MKNLKKFLKYILKELQETAVNASYAGSSIRY